VIELYFDGACEPRNPGGIATWGFVAFKDGKYLHEASGVYSHKSTNNEAEFCAALEALKYLVDQGLKYDKIIMRGDSQLVVNVLNGDWNLKAENLVPLYRDIRAIERSLPQVKYTWIPREDNEYADDLSRKEYEQFIREGVKP